MFFFGCPISFFFAAVFQGARDNWDKDQDVVCPTREVTVYVLNYMCRYKSDFS